MGLLYKKAVPVLLKRFSRENTDNNPNQICLEFPSGLSTRLTPNMIRIALKEYFLVFISGSHGPQVHGHLHMYVNRHIL